MTDTVDWLPSDLIGAHALILAERAARLSSEARTAQAETDLTHAQATSSSADALIARLKLEIEKLRRTLYGVRSERKERLIDQLEMQLEDAEAGATEDELAAERAAPSTTVKSFERKRPVRKPFAEHLPRERVVIAAPQSCPCCGSTSFEARREPLGLPRDVTETLEVVPRRWKVIQTVRERFSCRQCEAIAQPPAPFHVTPRGFAGPSLLAMILFEKFGQHQPLNRQSERYACEGVELSLSTLADQVGACAAALRPLHALIEAHALSAERLHGDDTTVPILAKGRTQTGQFSDEGHAEAQSLVDDAVAAVGDHDVDLRPATRAEGSSNTRALPAGRAVDRVDRSSPIVATTSMSGSFASAASVGAATRPRLWFAKVACVTRTTLREPSSSSAQGGSVANFERIGGVPTKCTVDCIGCGYLKLGAVSCM